MVLMKKHLKRYFARSVQDSRISVHFYPEREIEPTSAHICTGKNVQWSIELFDAPLPLAAGWKSAGETSRVSEGEIESGKPRENHESVGWVFLAFAG